MTEEYTEWLNTDDGDDDDDDDDDNDEVVTHTVAENEMFNSGLLLAGYTKQQLQRCKQKTNRYRFNATFGASPAVLCTILTKRCDP